MPIKMSVETILYLGAASGTSLDRAQALRRLGCSVFHVDPYKLLPNSALVGRLTWKVGGHFFAPLLESRLKKVICDRRFDLCLVDTGEYVTPSVLRLIRQYAEKIVNYNVDDPTGRRDGRRFHAYRQAIRHYDLAVVVREENAEELRALGVEHVHRVFMSFDEVSHAPRELTGEDRKAWASDVLFCGTWMPERGPFMMELIRARLPVTIRGDSWYKAPEWNELRSYWKGAGIYGDDYAKAIQCARISLGLVSKGNRDLHTTRSLEIPALGGLLCAKRTPEHSQLYVEGREAVFWETASECVQVCKELLSDEARRRAIAEAGQKRAWGAAHRNETVMRSILDRVQRLAASPRRGEKAREDYRFAPAGNS
jgi:hypothetical protein